MFNNTKTEMEHQTITCKKHLHLKPLRRKKRLITQTYIAYLRYSQQNNAES